ncbi:hypothetical protein OsI_25374 [Oryza sativa Indica Group]|uniref:Uncharacterized protein n=2 Tax=Oryza sativa TaxID=4530 RepID=B9FW67_ORYSJ|nr:hypothetical protein OsI_25374 [Oryza sativa Indica Group]EEE66804.1 hypothetical protein OsJ_23553 [Oryza sativa Japonica Group]
MAQMGRRAAQEEQRQRQGGMNGTTAVQACSTQRRQQASDKPTSQASITPSTAPVVDMAETSVPNLGMKPKISERTSNTKATMGTRMNPYGCCRHARCPPVRCHAADKRAGAAIRMNISCCSYNTCEDSTIKCTMTQFEDQFSTIKPDGIQVRCRKDS